MPIARINGAGKQVKLYGGNKLMPYLQPGKMTGRDKKLANGLKTKTGSR